MLVIVLLVQLLLASWMADSEATPLQDHSTFHGEKCFDHFNNCKHNSTCSTIYKSVKKTCRAKDTDCYAASSDLQQCTEDIDYLKIFFHSKCRCMNFGYPIKKLMKCTDIYNMIFSNPCYENGLKARDEARRLAAVTMRAFVVSTESDNVTDGYDSGKDNSMFDVHLTAESIPDAETRYSSTEETRINEDNDVAEYERDVTEEELRVLDDYFAYHSIDHVSYDISDDVIDTFDSNDVNESDASDEVEITKLLPPPTTVHDIIRDDIDYEEINEPRRSSSVRDDATPTNHHVLHLVLIVTGSLLILLLAIAVVCFYKRSKRRYRVGRILKNSCHSAVIIKSQQEKDLNTTNHL